MSVKLDTESHQNVILAVIVLERLVLVTHLYICKLICIAWFLKGICSVISETVLHSNSSYGSTYHLGLQLYYIVYATFLIEIKIQGGYGAKHWYCK